MGHWDRADQVAAESLDLSVTAGREATEVLGCDDARVRAGRAEATSDAAAPPRRARDSRWQIGSVEAAGRREPRSGLLELVPRRRPGGVALAGAGAWRGSCRWDWTSRRRR